MPLTGDFGTSETGAPMHGLGPEAIGRDILDTFNDADPVSLGGRRPPTADEVPA